jgi:diguanylate cyclase (GGDEF)-like protein
MSDPVDLKGDQYSPTLSMGIAIYPRHAQSRKKLIESADQAMYEAKQRGRDSKTSNFAFAGEEAAA